MSESATSFDPGIEQHQALLQGRPEFWSYSSLKEVNACPRRYVLSHAKYPDLWDGQGYPAMPNPAALFGDVVHGALDVIVKRLAAAGCTSLTSPGAVDVVRSLGGYTAVVEKVLEKRLARLDDNPSVNPERRRRLGIVMADRVSEARTQVQEYLSRTKLPLGTYAEPNSAPPLDVDEAGVAFGRRAIGVGAHPEITLASEDLRVMGRIDLLTMSDVRVEIVDYKTGAEDPAHLDQLRLYALLWDADREVNPDRRPVDAVIAAYPSREVTSPAPSPEERQDLEQVVRDRIAIADAECEGNPPRARPSPELCALCPVRGLCDDYWSTIAPDPSTVRDGTWFDYEGIVGPQNGLKSWWMLRPGSRTRDLLLRTTANSAPLVEGTHVRVLGLRLDKDPEVEATVAVLTSGADVLVFTS